MFDWIPNAPPIGGAEIESGGSWYSLVFIQKNKRHIYVIKKCWLRTKTDIKTI